MIDTVMSEEFSRACHGSPIQCSPGTGLVPRSCRNQGGRGLTSVTRWWSASSTVSWAAELPPPSAEAGLPGTDDEDVDGDWSRFVHGSPAVQMAHR